MVKIKCKSSSADKVDLIENAEFGYCSLIKATENVLPAPKRGEKGTEKINYGFS